MTNYHVQIVDGLTSILDVPVVYDLTIDDKTPIPCVSYLEISNLDNSTFKTFKDVTDKEVVSYQIRISGYVIGEIIDIACDIDDFMKTIYFQRTGCIEMVSSNGLIQKVITYRITN